MTNEQDVFVTISQAGANGCAVAELNAQYPELSRRTMQRRLSTLVEQGRIGITGQGRTRRYYALLTIDTLADAFPSDIPLSQAAKEILQYIEQPLTARKPVPYQRDFLDSYEPNKSYYLPANLRQQLKNMGSLSHNELPSGTYLIDLLKQLLVDLSWASSQLEGNTYSRLDTQALIEHGKVAAGKAVFETQMILNHKAAIEFVTGNINEIGFNRYSLFNLHSLLAENLLGNPADEGRIRQQNIAIGKSVYQPLSIPSQLAEQLDLILQKVELIADPFEQAFFLMVHLPYLQAFVDINKRTSRLAANIPLLKNNLCPLSFVGLSEQAYSRAILGVYELTRIELLRDVFMWAYERSTQEYLAIRQNSVAPSPLRLAYREQIKQSIYHIVTSPDADVSDIIKQQLTTVDKAHQAEIEDIIIEELKRLHEGTLARYGLRLTEFQRWQAKQA